MAQGHARMSYSLSAISVIRFVKFKLCSSVGWGLSRTDPGKWQRQRQALAQPQFDLSIIVFSDSSACRADPLSVLANGKRVIKDTAGVRFAWLYGNARAFVAE